MTCIINYVFDKNFMVPPADTTWKKILADATTCRHTPKTEYSTHTTKNLKLLLIKLIKKKIKFVSFSI